MIAQTPKPPYFAVIFSSQLSEDTEGYADMAQRMVDLATLQPGFLGIESARDGIGITVSYWSSLEAVQAWKTNVDHQLAQKLGRERWYQHYKVRIANVERDYEIE